MACDVSAQVGVEKFYLLPYAINDTMDEMLARGTWIRITVWLFSLIVILLGAVVMIHAPPGYYRLSLRDYYGLLSSFLTVFYMVSISYLLSLTFAIDRGFRNYANPPRTFIPMTLTISYHSSLIGSIIGMFILFLSIPLSFICCMLWGVLTYAIITPALIYALSMDFLKLEHVEALRVAMGTAFGCGVLWSVPIYLSMVFYEYTPIYSALLFTPVFTASLAYFVLWYFQRHREWVDGGRHLRRGGTITMRDLLTLAIPCLLSVGAMVFSFLRALPG